MEESWSSNADQVNPSNLYNYQWTLNKPIYHLWLSQDLPSKTKPCYLWDIFNCRYSSDGKFVLMLQIGRTLHDTDEYLLTMTGQSNGQQTTSLPGNRNPYRNFRENVINQLKHRILTFLYRRAVSLTERDGNLFELRKFYQFFDQVKV